MRQPGPLQARPAVATLPSPLRAVNAEFQGTICARRRPAPPHSIPSIPDPPGIPPGIDHYRRPYEDTENPREGMQAYLDWEFGLVEQLRREGTHGFRVI